MERMSSEDLAVFIENTAHVLTVGRDRLPEWRRQLKNAVRTARKAQAPADVEFLLALEALLAGETPQLSADHPYAADLAKVYALLRGQSDRLSEEDLKVLVVNTVAVRTGAMPKRADEWRSSLLSLLSAARKEGAAWQAEVELFQAVLTILDGQRPSLPEGHAYAEVLGRIYRGIDGGLQERAIDDKALGNLIEDMIVALMDPPKIATMRRHLKQGRRRSQERRLKPEVEFYDMLLTMLDGEPPTLPDDHPYREAQLALNDRVYETMDEVEGKDSHFWAAIHAMLQAEDWGGTEKAVRERQDVLLSDGALETLDGIIASVEASHDEDLVSVLRLHRSVLVACREKGITETFDWLREQAAREEEDDDDDAAWNATDDDDDNDEEGS